ncbi:hypothetical protein AX15_007232 [Amanita polypyramis BW_CC]|nr:hypothetical protein AX15_007232 [Amanita polypyramis BW_CC]
MTSAAATSYCWSSIKAALVPSNNHPLRIPFIMVKNAKNVCRVVYKPEHDKPDEFIVIVNPAEYRKWKAGDTSIPLSEVVDSFQVFHSSQGAQGLLGTPSHQQLDNIFGTHKDNDVVSVILQKGSEQQSDGIRSDFGTTNLARGSAVLGNGGRNVTGSI